MLPEKKVVSGVSATGRCSPAVEDERQEIVGSLLEGEIESLWLLLMISGVCSKKGCSIKLGLDFVPEKGGPPPEVGLAATFAGV